MTCLGKTWLGTVALALFCTTSSAATEDRGSNGGGLEPGEFVTHTQRIPIDIVLIGFEPGQANAKDLAAVLPATYSPLVRFPQFRGLEGRNLGLEYRFAYNLVRTDRSFTTRFFRYLASIGTEGAPTRYQEQYNAQEKNVLDVTGPILYIDAPSVERWLVRNATPRERGYTIYFINWYSRDDFRFHVYTKTDEPDPDTEFNFGSIPQTAITSWGGTTSRTWFYDFSAGPEWNTSNWVVDIEDLDDNGVTDYRMPVIWEYAQPGYRSPGRLGHDMGLLARYVAINLLFTPSPLYDPLVTAPAPDGAKVAHITMFEDDPANKGSTFIDPQFALEAMRRFQPFYRWKTALKVIDPIDPGAKRALDIFTGNLIADDCWNEFGDVSTELFCYFAQNLRKYVPRYPSRDYVAENFAFNTTETGLGEVVGLLGFADDNQVDGTQTFVFAFGADTYQAAGFGFTITVVHEMGHHIGLSHPHDGYDSESGVDYDPADDFFFAWEGDESDTVMHYLSVSNGFGQHNRDNMYRWEAAGYLNFANALAGEILADRDSWKVREALGRANDQAARAKQSFGEWNYLEAAARARNAYAVLVEAADRIDLSSARIAAARVRVAAAHPPRLERRRLLLERLSGR